MADRVGRNLSTPESREYWERAEKTAEQVANWPDWKKAGINVSEYRGETKGETDRIDFERDGVPLVLAVERPDWCPNYQFRDATPDDLRAAGWVPASERTGFPGLLLDALGCTKDSPLRDLVAAVEKLKAQNTDLQRQWAGELQLKMAHKDALIEVMSALNVEVSDSPEAYEDMVSLDIARTGESVTPAHVAEACCKAIEKLKSERDKLNLENEELCNALGADDSFIATHLAKCRLLTAVTAERDAALLRIQELETERESEKREAIANVIDRVAAEPVGVDPAELASKLEDQFLSGSAPDRSSVLLAVRTELKVCRESEAESYARYKAVAAERDDLRAKLAAADERIGKLKQTISDLSSYPCSASKEVLELRKKLEQAERDLDIEKKACNAAEQRATEAEKRQEHWFTQCQKVTADLREVERERDAARDDALQYSFVLGMFNVERGRLAVFIRSLQRERDAIKPIAEAAINSRGNGGSVLRELVCAYELRQNSGGSAGAAVGNEAGAYSEGLAAQESASVDPAQPPEPAPLATNSPIFRPANPGENAPTMEERVRRIEAYLVLD